MSSRLGLVGSGLALATTALYVVLIVSEGNNTVTETAPWAATFGGVGLAAGAAAFLPPGAARRTIFAAGGGVLAALGLVSLMSIGILLLGTGAVLVGAAADEANAREVLLVAMIALLLTLVVLIGLL